MDVHLDDRYAAPERKAGHGICRVPADTGKLLKLRGLVRDPAAMIGDDRHRELAESDRSVIIPESPPCADHLRLSGIRKRSQRWELPQEYRELFLHPRRLRLLEHDFGE